MNETQIRIRSATPADEPAIAALIGTSARVLAESDYRKAQIEGALLGAWAVDTTLIKDRTYFVCQAEDGTGTDELLACGGWSYRGTLFGGDSQSGREPRRLDPRTEAARIRAFFVHPTWSRRGLGRALLARCESEARAAGFGAAELVATLPGERLYAAHGYQAVERREYPLPNGERILFVTMRRSL